jgi:general secretion pathway protein B
VSYILEALKKAEAQRGQGQVPGIHDQHMAPEFSGGASTGGQSLLIWIIMAMGLVMIGLLVWALWEPESASNSQASVASVRPVAQGPAQAAPPPAPAVPAVPAPPPAAVAVQAMQAQASPPAQEPRSQTEAQAPFPTAPVPSRNERKAHADANETRRPAAQATATKPAQQDPPDLPEAMRPQLPKLAFGGAMHSENPASRMLIVNGQLLHEGDAINPDLTLERIQLKQATFRYKGYRYTAQY